MANTHTQNHHRFPYFPNETCTQNTLTSNNTFLSMNLRLCELVTMVAAYTRIYNVTVFNVYYMCFMAILCVWLHINCVNIVLHSCFEFNVALVYSHYICVDRHIRTVQTYTNSLSSAGNLESWKSICG